MSKLISINGRMNHGKDTVGLILQALMTGNDPMQWLAEHSQPAQTDGNPMKVVSIRKFADPLKEMVARLLGVPVSKLEDREFKDSVLGPEWDMHPVVYINPQAKLSVEYFGTREEARAFAMGNISHVKEIHSPIHMTVRMLMQKFGTDAVRNNVHPNAWVNCAFAQWNEDRNWIFTDCRFPNEAQASKNREGIVIRVVNPRIPKPATEHESEYALDHWKFDAVIVNDDTLEDLADRVRRLAEHFKFIS